MMSDHNGSKIKTSAQLVEEEAIDTRITTGTTTTTTAVARLSDHQEPHHAITPKNNNDNHMEDSQSDAVQAAESIRSLLNSIVASSSQSQSLSSTVPKDAPQQQLHLHPPISTTYYLQRLRSFMTVHYFAKPVHLSPILCALTGWELLLVVVSSEGTRKSTSLHTSSTPSSLMDTTSRLQCQCCRAILTIYIPNTLSTKGRDELILQYQQRLHAAHSVSCLFRKPSEYFINTSLSPMDVDTTDTTGTATTRSYTTGTLQQQYSLVVPTLLSRAIQHNPHHHDPLSSLELVEQIRPWNSFIQKFIRLFPYIHQLDTSNCHSNILPDHIQFYYHDKNSTSSSSSSPPQQLTSLLSRLVTCMYQQHELQHQQNDDSPTSTRNTTSRLPNMDTPKEMQVAEITIALIITGWDLQESDVDKGAVAVETVATPHIHCIFCLSRQRLIDHSNPSFLVPDQNNNNKRQRTNVPASSSITSQWNQPYMAHRYYCPWVCGFPLTRRVGSGDDTNRPPSIDTASTVTGNTLTFSLPLWQVLTNRLLIEGQQIPQHKENDDNEANYHDNNHNNNNTMIQNFLSIHEQLRSSISPIRYNQNSNTIKLKSVAPSSL
jgi:C3HC zinc finger-like